MNDYFPSAKSVAVSTKDSVSKHEPNDLAYLGLTGKIELLIRDSLAIQLKKDFPSLTIAREWKRHDLAILKDSKVLALIEGKQWLSNEVDAAKLARADPKHGIISAMEADIQKMAKTSNLCQKFISTIFIATDIDSAEKTHLVSVKYIPLLKKMNLSHNLETTHQTAIQKYVQIAQRFGTCSREQLFAGSAYGCDMICDVVITEIKNPILAAQ